MMDRIQGNYARRTLLIIDLLLFSAAVYAQNKLEGHWKGSIEIQGRHLTIKADFQKDDGDYSGTLDIPAQGAVDLPLQKITLSGRDSVSFQFDAGPNIGRFKGLFEGDTTINGTYYQAGSDFPFKLTYANLHNMQQYQPVHQKDLIIQNDSLAIVGSLNWPKIISADQLVIALSGSGAHNRDEVILGFKIFGIIDDYLTRHRIAVFRLD